MKKNFLIILFLSQFIMFYELIFASDIAAIKQKYNTSEVPLSIRNMRSWGGRSLRPAKSALQVGTGVPKEFINSGSIKNNDKNLQNQYNSKPISSYKNNNNDENQFFSYMSESDEEELDALLSELLKEYDDIDVL